MINRVRATQDYNLHPVKPDYKQNFNGANNKLAQNLGIPDSKYLRAFFLKPSFCGDLQQLTHDKVKKIIPSAQHAYVDKLSARGLLKGLIEELSQARPEQIRDFFAVSSNLDVKDKENLTALARSATSCKDGSEIINTLYIQDNWLQSILTNPAFGLQDKIYAIQKNSKPICMGEVVKHGNLFINTNDQGNMVTGLDGLYTDDTQFINSYKLSVTDNNSPIELKAFTEDYKGYSTNYKLEGSGITIRRQQLINKALFERINAENKSATDKSIKLDLSCKVQDIFEARGIQKEDKTFLKPEHTPDGGIILNTQVEPGRNLGVKVIVKDKNDSPIPVRAGADNTLTIETKLPAGSNESLEVIAIPMLNNKPLVAGENVENIPANFGQAMSEIKNAPKTTSVEIEGTGKLKNANSVISRAVTDLQLLTNTIAVDGKEYEYVCAGIPRFGCLFGRDSIITSMSVLPVRPELAKSTLELLAKYQGKSFEEKFAKELSRPGADINALKERYIDQEEEKGKILHELRVGELARQQKIRHTPYFGTVDATPLWLMLAANYYNWTGDKETIKSLLPNIENALNWINTNLNEDGFLIFKDSSKSATKELESDHSDGKKKTLELKNKGWKDSPTSCKHNVGVDGKLAWPNYPIALAEVQSYVYSAKKEIAKVYKELGMPEKAAQLEKEATELKDSFNKKFWLDQHKFIAMAVDADGKAIPSVTSNGGQVLSSGIVHDKARVKQMEEKLMAPQMNTGWGIRTLSSDCPAFDAMSYHNGSVWSHDTALIAKGLSRQSASELAGNLFEAADTFPLDRMPELYGGFTRKPDDTAIQKYSEASSPQAWSSGSLIDILFTTLGAQPDIKNGTIKFINPVIPEGMNKIRINDLKVIDKERNAETIVNLEFSRSDNGVILTAKATDGRNLSVEKQGKDLLLRI